MGIWNNFSENCVKRRRRELKADFTPEELREMQLKKIERDRKNKRIQDWLNEMGGRFIDE